ERPSAGQRQREREHRGGRRLPEREPEPLEVERVLHQRPQAGELAVLAKEGLPQDALERVREERPEERERQRRPRQRAPPARPRRGPPQPRGGRDRQRSTVLVQAS